MAYTAIDDPSAHFQIVLWTGDGESSNAVTFGGNSDLQPDMTWIKNRDGTNWHVLHDSSRGITKVVYPNDGNEEETNTTHIVSWNSDGLTLGDSGNVNTDTKTYVAWNWKANGGSLTSVSASGSGASNVLAGNYQANTTAGFSIMTFTGDETESTVTHGLGAAPDFIIVRARTRSSNNWIAWHSSVSTGTQYLNSNNANDTSNGPYFMGDDSSITQPTSTVFTVGANIQVNHDGESNVAWAWRSIQGYSKFSSYTGNGNADGTFVYTGFKPAFIMARRIDTGANWYIFDTARSTYNSTAHILYPDGNWAEATSTTSNIIDINSNGFKCRDTAGDMNGSGATIMYAAFAEQPFVTSEGIPCTAR